MSGSEYLRSPMALAKIAEFILLLTAFVAVYLYNNFHEASTDVWRPIHTERISLFLISTIFLWVLASFIFVFSLSKLSERIRHWNFLILVISVFSATVLLIASSLLSNEIVHLTNYSTPLGKVNLCETMKHSGKQTCGQLQVAAACGFSATLLFIGDIVVYCFKFKEAR